MEIAPGVYSISQKKGIYVHAFLLDDGDGLTLVDTLYSNDASYILAELQKMGRKASDIRRILLTHGHRAHLGGLAPLKQASGAPVYCHAWEADIIAGERRPQCMSLRPMRPYRLWHYQVASRFGKHNPVVADHIVNGGERVGPLQVIHAPGHTPGHLVFYWPERKALFAGDALVTYPILEPGWRAFTLNMKQNLVTLRMLAAMDVSVLGVGHGDPLSQNVNERLNQLANNIHALV
jgi:glyoxylase-like metal-dependent hydrolase (beta-lactamase superfamily II)